MVSSMKNEFLKSGNGHKRAPLKQTNKRKWNNVFQCRIQCYVCLLGFSSVRIGAQNAKYYISAFYIYFKNFLKPSKFNSFSLKLVYDVRLSHVSLITEFICKHLTGNPAESQIHFYISWNLNHFNPTIMIL